MSRLLDVAAAFAAGDEKREQIATPALRLTPAQREALLWLSADLTPRFPTLLSDPNMLELIDLEALGLAVCMADISTNQDDHSFRLTPAGIAARQAIERDA